MMAAFDSDKQPTVKPNNGSVSSIKDGMATLKMTAPASGEMKITGSVGIANKRGEIKEKTYETKIQVATKSGALEMPEYQVLYRGYDNKIIPSASGVVTYDINVSGCSKQPFTVNGKKGYILKPGSGVKSVSVSLSGKDLKGKSIPFGSWTYSVKPFPNPEIKTSSVSKGSGAKITVGLPADSPLKSPAFQVVGVEVLGVDNGQCPGGNIPGNIVAKLKAGKSIGINVTVKNPLTGSTVIIPGALKVTN